MNPDGSAATDDDNITELFRKQFFPENPRSLEGDRTEDIPQLNERSWPPFSNKELRDELKDTSNFTAPGPDHVPWRTWKRVCKFNPNVIVKMRIFFNAFITYEHWPKRLKRGLTLCLAKPGRDHTKAKGYRPIILLDTIGKWFEKLGAKRIQFDGQKYGILHPSQFGGTMQHSTTDAGAQLVHNIRQGWTHNMDSTILLFDVSAYYPSIRHDVLIKTMRKQGFNTKFVNFMSSYLTGRETHLLFQNHVMGPIDITQGLGQGSCLSPILSGIYIAPAIHRWSPVARVGQQNLSLHDMGKFHD